MQSYIFEGINRTNRRVDAVVKLIQRQDSRIFWTGVAVVVLAYKVYKLSKEVKELDYEEEGE